MQFSVTPPVSTITPVRDTGSAVCSVCGMRHAQSLEEMLGRPVRPVTARELENQLAKDGLKYTVTMWAGGKAICQFDRILGRLWQATANAWRSGRTPNTYALIERLRLLGIPLADESAVLNPSA